VALDRERAHPEGTPQERADGSAPGRRSRGTRTADVTLTTDQSDVEAALDALNPKRVIDDTILGAGWTDRLSDTTDRSGDGRRAFVPVWTAGYKSGNATYVG